MELKDFIAQTLIQIQQGVKEAIDKTKSNSTQRGYINPVWQGAVSDTDIQKVKFDVAVTVADKTSGGGNAGIKVAGIVDLGGGKTASTESSSISRVQFEVPIITPHSDPTE